MQTVILAGGLGTRIADEVNTRPKPMVEVGGQPILWHIMKHYSHYGFNDFIICCGYKGHEIKEYFADYYLHRSDVTFDFTDNNKMTVHSNVAEPWKVTLVDTGQMTQTGGRIRRIRRYVGEEPFFLTYGDGVSDIDLNALLAFHREQKEVVTISAIRPGGRFGVLDFGAAGRVKGFREKATADGGWINAGFMVCESGIFDYLDGDGCILERGPFQKMASDGRLCAYRHCGFWQCMDTQRDRGILEGLWQSGKAPWKLWKDEK
jgi:glucose-1-phosphate cytidylyltransferase